MIEWDYGKDLVTVLYDATRTTPEGLAKEITALGYKVEVIPGGSRPARANSKKRRRVLVPDDAPKFFREAFATARANKQPLVLDFWASWCGPCIRLKKETFADKEVTKLLEGIPVVFVDLDEYPALGEAYRVDSVPDVFLIDRDGFIVDRLLNFEPPAVFAKRLKKLVGRQPMEAASAATNATSLEDSLTPLRSWFNANKDRPRFITLLSPT